MKFVCEDLPQHGLRLVPPSSPDYDPLLADIERHLDDPGNGAPPVPDSLQPRISDEDRSTSAILINGSSKPIAAMQMVWFFETVSGRSYRHSHGMLSVQSLLIPFGRKDEASQKLYNYWLTILPASKRYISESGMIGNNTDVRLPTPDEMWTGGVGGGGARAGGTSREPVREVKLVLDGAFFTDGEFIGPNREKLFERTVADAEGHLIVSQVAREGQSSGLSPAAILYEVRRVTGPAPSRPPMNLAFRNPNVTTEELRTAALQRIGFQLAMRRKLQQPDDVQTVNMIVSWADAVLPNFRKG